MTTALLVRSYVRLVACAAVLAYISIYSLDATYERAPFPIRSDGWSYYSYVPAWITFHDPSMRALANDCCGGAFPTWTAIDKWPATGQWVSAHPIGEAILMLPFGIVAQALSWWSNFPRDGFSFYYQHAAGLAGVFYLCFGLWCMRRALLKWFSPGVTLATLVCITFGTDLFHYGVFDSTFSHVYAFFLIAAMLNVLPEWLDGPTLRRSLLLGSLAGLLVLVRHAHVIVLLGLSGYGIFGPRSLRERVDWIRRHAGAVTLVAAVGAVWLTPQLLIYHHATGHWLINLYGAQRTFTFSDPHILGVLFLPNRGVFFWSPVLLLSLAGFVLMRRRLPDMLLPILIILPLSAYLIASWFDWQFGAAFGHRGFTDLLPFFAMGMAIAIERARRTRLVIPIGIAAALAVALSIAQMVQYWIAALPYGGMTWASYAAAFLKFSR